MQLFAGKRGKSNEECIEQVILEHYNQYYRLAYSYVHNDADACDIVQNGAYKALRGSGTLRNQEFAKTWVYRIMLNEIYDFVKNPRMESIERLEEEQGKSPEYTEDVYEDVDLKRALDSLPAEEKTIIVMKYYEDKKLEEIADILNENVNTVKSRLYRSMKKLRIMLADG